MRKARFLRCLKIEGAVWVNFFLNFGAVMSIMRVNKVYVSERQNNNKKLL